MVTQTISRFLWQDYPQNVGIELSFIFSLGSADESKQPVTYQLTFTTPSAPSPPPAPSAPVIEGSFGVIPAFGSPNYATDTIARWDVDNGDMSPTADAYQIPTSVTSTTYEPLIVDSPSINSYIGTAAKIKIIKTGTEFAEYSFTSLVWTYYPSPFTWTSGDKIAAELSGLDYDTQNEVGVSITMQNTADVDDNNGFNLVPVLVVA
jgi:hypothetical protein